MVQAEPASKGYQYNQYCINIIAIITLKQQNKGKRTCPKEETKTHTNDHPADHNLITNRKHEENP